MTMEEELIRTRMEVEDCRARVTSVMQASASLLSFYQVWLAPGQVVRPRPHYARLLSFSGREAGYRHRLVKRAADGRWRLATIEGPNRGKELWTDVHPEALMP